MPIHGPYKVTVTFDGLTQIYNEVYLELGKPLNLDDAILKDESQQLSEVMVTGAKSKVFLVVVGRVRDYNRKKRANCFTNYFKISRRFYTIEPSASGGSLEVEMINTTVTH
jgi:hypothetical protein